MHTESTLTILELTTTSLGNSARRFAKELETQGLDIRELPTEEAARHRRDTKATQKKQNRSTQKAAPNRNVASSSQAAPKGKAKEAGAKRKTLNLETFKFHNLRHYVESIRRFGPTDCYSTQTGELEHRRAKRFYGRTSRKVYEGQIGTHFRRQQLLNSIAKREKVHRRHNAQPETTSSALPRKRGRPRKDKSSLQDSDPLTSAPFRAHHHMSDSTRGRLDITQFAVDNHKDPAIKNFVSLLKNHLIPRVLRKTYSGDEEEYTPQERMQLQFHGNRFYKHLTLHINYTSYDLRRDQDVINPNTHSDVMVLAHEDDSEDNKHPYWYARILGIYHADVRYMGPGSNSEDYERMEFVWVRWFGRDLTTPGGFAAKRLHRVGFVPDEDGSSGAFGFLDPQFIIRGVHLIPAFHHGRTTALLRGPSPLARCQEDDDSDKDEDWQFYYVNMFVDRDMLMRYLGGGVGHKALRAIVKIADTLAALGHLGQPTAEETADSDMDETADVDSENEASGDKKGGSVMAEGSEPEDEEDSEREEYGYEDSSDDEDAKDEQDNLGGATESGAGSDSKEDEEDGEDGEDGEDREDVEDGEDGEDGEDEEDEDEEDEDEEGEEDEDEYGTLGFAHF